MSIDKIGIIFGILSGLATGGYFLYDNVATSNDVEALASVIEQAIADSEKRDTEAQIESEKRDIDLQIIIYNNELREYTEEGLANLSDTERQNYDDMIKIRDGLQARRMLLIGLPGTQ